MLPAGLLSTCCVHSLHFILSIIDYSSAQFSFHIFSYVQSNNQVVCSSLGVVLIAEYVEGGVIKGFSIGILRGRRFSMRE